jgi:prepilin peptidase CpaA
VTTPQMFLVASVAACAVAAWTDVRTGCIPNWLTLGGLLAAPLAHGTLAFVHHGTATAVLSSVGASAGGATVAAILPTLLWHRGGLGLGDAKLFALLGAACGAFVALYAQTYAYAAALVYAVVVVWRRGTLSRTFRNVQGLVAGRDASAAPAERNEGFTEVRFAPAILAGMCIAAYARWRA